MSKATEDNKAIMDDANIEIMEDSQDMIEDAAGIEQAEEHSLIRAGTAKIVECYLDGKEYDLERITMEVRYCFERMANDYLTAGRLLLAVKKVEGHGNYLQWLEANFPLSPRTAQKFTRVAEAIQQRPDLARLATGGVSKALILLDLPDEYIDEAEQLGTIDGTPVDEFHTMTRRELEEEARRLKDDKDKIVDQETRNIAKERDALVEDNKRLKKFEPKEQAAPEWCIEQAKEIKKAVARLGTLCKTLMGEHSEEMEEDPHAQSMIEKNANQGRKYLTQLLIDMDKRYNQYE